VALTTARASPARGATDRELLSRAYAVMADASAAEGGRLVDDRVAERTAHRGEAQGRREGQRPRRGDERRLIKATDRFSARRLASFSLDCRRC
jgi:hypothetical protein